MLLGAGGFGLVIGWYVYYVNRHRKDDVQLSDVVTLLGAIGGGAVLSLFEARSELFGAYGIGLALGFFGYFTTLLLLVRMSMRGTQNFTWEWFLDGRRKDPPPGVSCGGPRPMNVPGPGLGGSPSTPPHRS
jgi:hypothetical protein